MPSRVGCVLGIRKRYVGGPVRTKYVGREWTQLGRRRLWRAAGQKRKSPGLARHNNPACRAFGSSLVSLVFFHPVGRPPENRCNHPNGRAVVPLTADLAVYVSPGGTPAPAFPPRLCSRQKWYRAWTRRNPPHHRIHLRRRRQKYRSRISDGTPPTACYWPACCADCQSAKVARPRPVRPRPRH